MKLPKRPKVGDKINAQGLRSSQKNVVFCKNYLIRVIFVEKNGYFKKSRNSHMIFRSLEKRRHKWRWRSILRRVHWCNCSTENNKLLKNIINYLFTASNKTGITSDFALSVTAIKKSTSLIIRLKFSNLYLLIKIYLQNNIF